MSTESILWMGEIESWMNDEIIMKSFKELGINPKSVKTIKDKKLNLIKNFCFINFENMNEASKALNSLNGKKFPKSNVIIKLNWANKNSEGNIKLYVGNIPLDVKDIELYNLFKSKYPSVYHAAIISDEGISKGYGFIYFLDDVERDKCLKEMDGYTFQNHTICIREAKVKKDEKRGIEKNNKFNDIIFKNNINVNNSFNIKKELKIKSRKNNNKNNLNSTKNKFNIFYKPDNNCFINNSKSFKDNHLNKFSLCPKRKKEVDISQESTFSSQENDKGLSTSNPNLNKKRKFSENIELLGSNDEETLNKKIQESINKMVGHYMKNKSSNFTVSKIVKYYCSDTHSFSD